jgi:hypothetical protein
MTAGLSYSSSAKAAVTICFYNPETNIDNFATLKTSFDEYLTKAGEFTFQPFNDEKVFEEAIAQKKCQIYLLSSWYFETLQQQIPLKIALIGTLKGNTTQTKVLTAKKELSDVAALKNMTVASASSESYSRNALEKMVGSKNKAVVDSIKIFNVPRDMEALLAVGYGAASAAISTEGSWSKLATMNPNQFQQLHTLGTTEKNYFLVAATSEKPNKKQMQALEILQKMATNSAGGKTLNLLGLDGWVAK